MKREIYFEPWLLNVNFLAAVDMWREKPDSEMNTKRVEILLNSVKDQGLTLTVGVSTNVLNRVDSESVAIRQKDAEYYAEKQGNKLLFKMGDQIRARVARIKTERFLVMETIHGEKFFFKPQDVASLTVE